MKSKRTAPGYPPVHHVLRGVCMGDIPAAVHLVSISDLLVSRSKEAARDDASNRMMIRS